MIRINTDDLTPSRLDEYTQYMSRFITDDRVEALRNVVARRTRYITLCVENIYDPHNASAVLRTAEAFGLQDVFVIDSDIAFEPSKSIVRGTDKWLDITRVSEENASRALIERLRGKGYRIVATSPHSEGVAPEDYDVSKGKIALFMGTERRGLSETVLSMADDYVTIPMYGFVESLNLSVCTAIILNAFTRALRSNPAIDWRLSEEETRRILFQWTMMSVKDSERILKNYKKKHDKS